MIAVCVPVTNWEEYARCALPGIERLRSRAPDTVVLARDGTPSYQAAVNAMLDELAAEPRLGAAVIIHQDVELLDAQPVLRIADRFAAHERVAIIGAAGGTQRSGLDWSAGRANVHRIELPEPWAPVFLPAGFLPVESVDGLLIALSPWAVRTLRFDPAFANNFHGYDMDISLQARAHGRLVAVDSIPVRHHKVDGYRGARARQWAESDRDIRHKWDLPRHTPGRAWTLGAATDAQPAPVRRKQTLAVVIPTLTPTRAEQLAATLAAEADRVVIVDNSARQPFRRSVGATMTIGGEHNLGFGAAVMSGVAECDEELLLLLNDDVIPGPGFIAAMLAPFDDPDVHAVAACLNAAGTGRVDSLGVTVDRTLRCSDARGHSEIPSVIGPSGAAAAYRRASFLAVGGYAPELFAYWEDVDLALRMWSAGLACRVAEDAVAEHRRGSTLGYRSARQRQLDAFGRGFILGRYGSWLNGWDRFWIPLLDWPSLVRCSWKLRSPSILAARAAGRRAGSRSPQPPPVQSLPRRGVRATLVGQLSPGR